MHQDFGPWSRFLINRDSTFLSLLGSLGNEGPSRISTCCNPLAPPKRIYDSGPHVEYAADITICALDIKLRDDAEDESFARRIAARIGSKSLAPATDRALARLNWAGFPSEEVARTILSQNQVEASRPRALAAAQPTGEAYGEILAFGNRHQPNAEGLFRQLGQSLGRLIYWDDAWRDWRKDQRKGRFNPLSTTPAQEVQELMSAEYATFAENVGALANSPATDTLLGVVEQTRARIPVANETPEEAEKKRRKRERKDGRDGYCRKDNCCDSMPCCDCSCPTASRGGSMDWCFDCGPGDTGCIDCCPCDGCSCC